jgi:hypothetical protein
MRSTATVMSGTGMLDASSDPCRAAPREEADPVVEHAARHGGLHATVGTRVASPMLAAAAPELAKLCSPD